MGSPEHIHEGIVVERAAESNVCGQEVEDLVAGDVDALPCALGQEPLARETREPEKIQHHSVTGRRTEVNILWKKKTP